jgi:hypothetical protein
VLSDDDLMKLLNSLAVNPGAGQVIPGTNGLRKLRWAASGRGKRGGARVIYFWWLADDKILLLDIYEKKDKEDLSRHELKSLMGKVIK